MRYVSQFNAPAGENLRVLRVSHLRLRTSQQLPQLTFSSLGKVLRAEGSALEFGATAPSESLKTTGGSANLADAEPLGGDSQSPAEREVSANNLHWHGDYTPVVPVTLISGRNRELFSDVKRNRLDAERPTAGTRSGSVRAAGLKRFCRSFRQLTSLRSSKAVSCK